MHGDARNDRAHLAIQRESGVGAYSPMRMCAGPCKRRRSTGQFKGAALLCQICARRAPKATNSEARAVVAAQASDQNPMEKKND
jgi:hypothetical protein